VKGPQSWQLKSQVVCAAPRMVCECSGSGLCLNVEKLPITSFPLYLHSYVDIHQEVAGKEIQ